MGDMDGSDAQKRRILLVEDHVDTINVLARLLGKDYIVGKALCVKEAMEALAIGCYDVIVSDVGLPDGCGKQMIKQIKAKCEIKAIALTGYGMAEDIQSCKDHGFDAVLIKPISFSVLLATIIAMLGNGHAVSSQAQLLH